MSASPAPPPENYVITKGENSEKTIWFPFFGEREREREREGNDMSSPSDSAKNPSIFSRPFFCLPPLRGRKWLMKEGGGNDHRPTGSDVRTGNGQEENNVVSR